MKSSLFRKGAALVLAGAMVLSGMYCIPDVGIAVQAAANKARVSVHDPSVVKDGRTYYVFGSHIEAAKTNDLQNWTRFTNGYMTPNNVVFGDLSRNLQKAFAWCG
ncbi:MAG: transposase, partial [Oscillospiraceae bacterium]|nr:transposase [Oscillospiraceae bacterium]